MKKLLIVGDSSLKQALILVLTPCLSVPVIGCEYQDGLRVFKKETPSHVLILFADILSAAAELAKELRSTSQEVTILNSSLAANSSPDHFQMPPTDLQELVSWLETKLQ